MQKPFLISALAALTLALALPAAAVAGPVISFDANGEVVDVQVVRDRGGHPAFGTDVWCEAATAAFGIPFPS